MQGEINGRYSRFNQQVRISYCGSSRHGHDDQVCVDLGHYRNQTCHIDANTVLIALIDRIRMLDNDLIRLNQKVNTVLHLRGKTIEHERVEAEADINQKTVEAKDKK
jgi:hypothetical protein